MSLCVYLQQADYIIVGADTAITRTTEDGQRCRDSRGIEKVHRIGKYLVFVCGDLHAAQDVISAFNAAKIQSVPTLQRIIKDRYRQIIKEAPERIEAAKANDETLLSIVCFEMDQRGRTVSHVFNPHNGFKAEQRKGNDELTHIVAGGFKSKRALELAIAGSRVGVTDPKVLIRRVFESLSGQSIGGDLTLYLMDARGVEQISREKINEAIEFPIVTMPSDNGVLTGGTITGAMLRTSISGARVETDYRGWRTYDNAGRERISINANDTYGMSAISWGGSSGSGVGYINGGDTLFSVVSSRDMIIAALNGGTLTIQGNVNFKGGSIYGIDISDVGGLQSQLSSINSSLSNVPTKSQTATNMSFDPNTRNLKLYSATGQTLATVNIP